MVGGTWEKQALEARVERPAAVGFQGPQQQAERVLESYGEDWGEGEKDPMRGLKLIAEFPCRHWEPLMVLFFPPTFLYNTDGS